MPTDVMRRTDIRIDKLTGYMDLMQLYAVEGEYNGRSLRVQITNGGAIEDQTGVQLHFGFKSAATNKDGICAMTVVDITKGLYEVYYPSEMLEAAGTVICAIKIVDSVSISKTVNFSVQVRESVLHDGMEIPENSVKVFDKVIMDIIDHETRLAFIEANFAELVAQQKALLEFFNTNVATKSDWQGIKTVVDKIDLDTRKVSEIHDRLFSYDLVHVRFDDSTFNDTRVKNVLDVDGSGSLVAVRFITNDAYIQIKADGVTILDLNFEHKYSKSATLSMTPYYGFNDMIDTGRWSYAYNLTYGPQTFSEGDSANSVELSYTLNAPICFGSSMSIICSSSATISPILDVFYEVG